MISLNNLYKNYNYNIQLLYAQKLNNIMQNYQNQNFISNLPFVPNNLLIYNNLNKKMIRLQKIKTKNQEFEYSSIPLIRTEKGNLINELDYYTKKNKSYLSQNKYG